MAATQVAPGADATISGNLLNTGSGLATITQVGVFAPTGWTIKNLSLTGVGTCAGPTTGEMNCGGTNFDLGAGGDTQAMTFVVTPPAGTPSGLYPVNVNLWARASGFGGEAENLFPQVVMVPVGQVRSAAPTLTCPINSAASTVSGTTSEASGTLIRVYFDGILRCSTTTTGSSWSCSGFTTTTFGPLYGGVEIRATAQAPGELESVLSDPWRRGAVAACLQRRGGQRQRRVASTSRTIRAAPRWAYTDETNVGLQCSTASTTTPPTAAPPPTGPPIRAATAPDDPTERAECRDG
jgi:hypothetical protein